jgi:outer membrane protein assembly factor BamB
VIIGREGGGDINVGGGTIKASALEVDGVLYFTMPDNAWAVDARDGTELWHYFWKTKGGTHIGNRGLGMWHKNLYMETPDDYLVALNATTGKEFWHKPIADLSQGYFSTPGPVVVGNHVLVGTGNDIDAPGFIQFFDPETGAVQWRFYIVPQQKGDAGLDSWASLDAARHGGGSGRLRSGNKALYLQHPATRPRPSPPVHAAPATTCLPAQSWPSTSIPAGWRGITPLRRTTCTITIPLRRPSWSTPCSAAKCASWC